MTILIITFFYCYIALAINYYRREILLRTSTNQKNEHNAKAPIPIKKSVLYCVGIFILNAVFYFVLGADSTIIANILPALISLIVLKRYERKIIQLDRGKNHVLHKEKRYLDFFKRR